MSTFDRRGGGTYETYGGTPASPDVQDPPCAVCGLDPYGGPHGCQCEECWVCGVAGDPRCLQEHQPPDDGGY